MSQLPSRRLLPDDDAVVDGWIPLCRRAATQMANTSPEGLPGGASIERRAKTSGEAVRGRSSQTTSDP